MNRFVVAMLVAFTFTGIAHSQAIHVGDCVVDVQVWSMPACALENHHGKLFVSKVYLPLFFSATGKSVQAGTPAKLAWLKLPEGGWAYFNQTGLIVVRNVATFDNGPSPFHHGLVRITRDGKWGLANAGGKMIVPFTYDGLLEYQKDTGWRACIDCKSVQAGEYYFFQGGQWVQLDRFGKLDPNTPKQQN